MGIENVSGSGGSQPPISDDSGSSSSTDKSRATTRVATSALQAQHRDGSSATGRVAEIVDGVPPVRTQANQTQQKTNRIFHVLFKGFQRIKNAILWFFSFGKRGGVHIPFKNLQLRNYQRILDEAISSGESPKWIRSMKADVDRLKEKYPDDPKVQELVRGVNDRFLIKSWNDKDHLAIRNLISSLIVDYRNELEKNSTNKKKVEDEFTARINGLPVDLRDNIRSMEIYAGNVSTVTAGVANATHKDACRNGGVEVKVVVMPRSPAEVFQNKTKKIEMPTRTDEDQTREWVGRIRNNLEGLTEQQVCNILSFVNQQTLQPALLKVHEHYQGLPTDDGQHWVVEQRKDSLYGDIILIRGYANFKIRNADTLEYTNNVQTITTITLPPSELDVPLNEKNVFVGAEMKIQIDELHGPFPQSNS